MSTPGNGSAALVSELGERGLIDRIRRRLPRPAPDVVIGVGDDAAVVAAKRSSLQALTTDAFVEGVHFDRRFSRPFDIGYKALAVNVSDMAAMGATPRVALLSLILPAGLLTEDLDAVLDGLLTMAREAHVDLVGGNISRSPGPLVVDVALSGWVHPRKVLTRSGGHPGDVLYVSGRLGAATAGLDWLREVARSPADEPVESGLQQCVQRYRRPEPRTRLGLLLGRTRAASACMDLSDGLGDAIHQVAEASATGARIDAGSLPIDPAAAAWFTAHGEDSIERSIGGGDDYELLFAVPPRRMGRFRAVAKLARNLAITRIGELTAERDLLVLDQGGPRELPSGFVHF